MDNQILIISFWNPTEKYPQQGIFIQDQAAAVCSMRENVIFLQVNVLPSASILLKKTIEESAFFNNRRIVINLYSKLWKFYYANPWGLSRIVYNMIKDLRPAIRPAIIHSNVIYPCGIMAYLLSKQLDSKLVISEHWSKAAKFLKHPFFGRIALKTYQNNYAVICVSEFLSSKIAEPTSHKNIIVIPNIIDTGIFTYVPKPSICEERLTFMCVATWKPPKRLELIVDSLCEYANETSRQIVLRIVGNGIQADELKRRKVPENLHIEWPGYLNKPSIAAWLHNTNIFLHASDTETFSIVTAEALSTGTPVLASNRGALSELINEQNGSLAENDLPAWLRSIREIACKQFDYEAIARKNVSRYSSETVGRAILTVYQNALNDRT